MTKRTKKITGIIVLLGLIIAVAFGYYQYNKGPRDVNNSQAQKIEAPALYAAFSADTLSARKKYAGKVLLVSGTINDISLNQQNETIVLIQTNESGAYINCTLQEENKTIKTNTTVKIKGICSGMGLGDADLGIKGDVYLTRCIIVE